MLLMSCVRFRFPVAASSWYWQRMQGQKYQSIQFLRAVAALMVVIYHSKSAFGPEDRATLAWLPGVSDNGALGVSLFFVISGFIIANTLDRPSIDFGDFAWRRVMRIYPLYWIVMLAGLATFLWRGWYAADLEAMGISGMLASFLILPQEPFPFWNPGWSLEHELIFYLIAGLVVPKLGLRVLCAVMISLGIIGFWVHFWDYHLFKDAQFYFGAGVGAYLCRNASLKLSAVVAVVLLAAAYAHLYGFLEYSVAVRSLAFAFGFGALIVMSLGLERHGWKVPKLTVAIGDASYSLYLWHWLLLPFTGLAYWVYGGTPELWRWVFVVSSVLVALASYQLIERPINNWAHRVRKRAVVQPAE